MSILLHVPAPVKKLVVKSKRGEPTTNSILLMSATIFLSIIFVNGHRSIIHREYNEAIFYV